MHKLFAMLAVIAFALLNFVRLGGAQSHWNEIVEAAKREGTVVVVGWQGNETREALTVGFQKKYPEIKVEHSSTAGLSCRLSCSPSRRPSAIPSTCSSRARRRSSTG